MQRSFRKPCQLQRSLAVKYRWVVTGCVLGHKVSSGRLEHFALYTETAPGLLQRACNFKNCFLSLTAFSLTRISDVLQPEKYQFAELVQLRATQFTL